MKPILWLPLVAFIGFGGVAQAQPPHYGYGPGALGQPPYPSASRSNPGAEATMKLKAGMDKLLEFLEKDENKLQVAAFLDKEVAPYFDFDYMAKWVAGPRYARMDEDARKALAAKLEARFLSTLANRLSDYQGQKVRFLRPRKAGRGAVSIPVGIVRPGSYPAKLDFRMYRSDEGWKVYDVVANGRSASAYYRMQLSRTSQSARPSPYGR